MDVRRECCVLSGRDLCVELITRPEESYRLWRVVVCEKQTPNEEAKARYGAVKNTTKKVVTPRKQTNRMVIPYRRFGATYRSHIQGSGSPRRIPVFFFGLLES